MAADHPLDNPAWTSLTGAHAVFAQRIGSAVRYRRTIYQAAALPDDPDVAAWADLVALVGPGARFVVPGLQDIPPTFEVERRIGCLQLDGTSLASVPDPDTVVLGPADVPEMIDLVRRTDPGPFGPETHLLGTYLGIRRRGALVAMAGERMRPPGWAEISAVCTDPAYRGSGLAARLVRALGAVVRGRGDVPFLHVATYNTAARRLYDHLGFTLRRPMPFTVLRAPARDGSARLAARVGEGRVQPAARPKGSAPGPAAGVVSDPIDDQRR